MAFWRYILGFDPNQKRAFPGQQPGEEIVHMTTSHWVSLLPFALQIGLAVGMLLTFNLLDHFYFHLNASLMFGVNSVASTTLAHLFFFRMYNYLLDVIIITNMRIIDVEQTVFLKRERNVIFLQKIQDCRFLQSGLFPRLLKYGDLVVFGASSDVHYRFRQLPRVSKVHHILSDLQKTTMKNPPNQSDEYTIEYQLHSKANELA